MAAVNYDDERFQQVTAEQNQAIENVQNTYNQMINQADQFYQRQAQAAEDYGNKQAEIQQANTDFAIEKINQQKEQAQKDYTKEQKGAYVDWQKQSNRYGVNAELQAQQGLRNGGYSESSQVSMYNQYQNRVAQSRDSYNRAVLNYDNSIKEAQLTNNAKLAEIAYQALQTSLEINLNGFQYKNQLMTNQINALNAEKDRYYTRWQDVLKQVNYENEQAENLRRYEEQMALTKAKTYSSGGSKSGNSYTISNSGDEEDYSDYLNSNGQLASEAIKTIDGVKYIPQIDSTTGLQNGVKIDKVNYPLYISNGVLYIYKNGKMIQYNKLDNQTTTKNSIASAGKNASKISTKSTSNIKNGSMSKITPYQQLKNMAKSASKK